MMDINPIRISRHFILSEMCVTQTGLPNKPGDIALINLQPLCQTLLEPIRGRWGALLITSGYRSPEVNAAVGGSKTSQHLFGEAADFVPIKVMGYRTDGLDEVFKWIVKDSGLQWGQVILEPTWIHISLPRDCKPNQDALMFDGETYMTWEG